MESKEIEILAPHGLHLRVAAQIVKEIKGSRSKVVFFKDGAQADASSILELLVLGVGEKQTIKVTTHGVDERQAMDRVTEILTDGAGI